ncbi:hypothetical protein BK673_13870 [Pseudomonas fluorescens]|jgi:hypothetical protein|uniref:Uncharacterized protein n=1 Tax=Pseudomonas fluorescens TaxID=294 RepID=A0A423P5L2_PSEFL|nr:hypothetical protein BOW65_26260 [Pseudomonas koreensis]ROO08945.1 hypothetical protein BK673_13870 [Pseudomonas fluorescens]TKJ85909.1 hypothetical protein PkoCFBP13504_07960 [Pseudomonas koreensis]
MSGLREDQREVEVLVTLIFAALPPEPRWCIREQARSHRICAETEFSATPKTNVGASLLAKRPEQAPPI